MTNNSTAAEKPCGVTVAIQAGGESRRMGRSKATIDFGERPLLMRIVDRISPVADEILITTNEPGALTFLERSDAYDRIVLKRDILDKRGSLPGLLSALTYASNDFMCVCACDMYNVSAKLFEAELEIMREGSFDAVAPSLEEGLEPFHAVYKRSTCLPVVSELVRNGQMSMRSALVSKDLNVKLIDMSDLERIGVDERCFENCNTPEELARAMATAKNL